MKKILLLITLLCLLCASACNLDDETVTTDTDVTSEVTSAEDSVTTTEPETTADNKNNYNAKYSPVKFTSGDKSINPIQCFLGYAAADGLGVQEIFQNKDFDRSLFPTLILNDGITVDAPKDYEVSERIDVYNVYNVYNAYNTYYEFRNELTSLDEVTTLYDGEYLLVFNEKISNYGDNPDPNIKYENQLIFKLIVPEISDEDIDRIYYSPVVFTSGKKHIYPIECYLADTSYPGGTGDGYGAYWILGNKNFDKSKIPSLVLNGELTCEAPKNSSVSTSCEVYYANFTYKGTLSNLGDASKLSEGEYILVFYEAITYYYEDSGDIRSLLENELVFRLVVPEELYYSSVGLSASGTHINPVKFMFSSTEYENGEPVLEGDSDGAYRILGDPNFDHSRLPALQIGGGVSASKPAGTTWGRQGSVDVYDLNYNEVCTLSGLSALSDLEAGEYIIVMSEVISTRTDSSDLNYSVTRNDIVFKLIVP